MINEQRLWQHIQELSIIGKNDDGSITRWPFTKEDMRAQELLVTWMEEAGLQVHIDFVGNVIGVMQGHDTTLQPIVCGSHFDSVRCGGMFDGCLGVLAGIEVASHLHEEQIEIQRTLMIIGFKDEEGNRFSCGMVGSKSIAGVFDEESFACKDENDITLYDAMKAVGYVPEKFQQCKITPHALYELHIEQAKQLEDKQVPIAIVEGIAGLVRFQVRINGESNHAGATPMAYRIDPTIAMSEWILHMNAWAKDHLPLVLTVGIIETYPGACNIICDHVQFQVDIRSLHQSQLEDVEVEMMQLQSLLQTKHGVDIDIIKEDYVAPCLCDTKRQEEMKAICEQAKIPYIKTMSGAGHDCMNFNGLCPVSMIFVRSYKGYSHRKEEFSSMEDCAQGCNLLYEMIKNEVKK